LLPDISDRLAATARDTAAESTDQVLTVGRFRTKTGISRHATMPVLEFFDRIGITKRINEGRIMSTDQKA